MKLIATFLFAMMPIVGMAQNVSRRVSVAPHAGMTLSKMDGSAIRLDKTWKTGWTAGAEVEIPLSDYYSVITGADYSLIGTGLDTQREGYASQKSHINVSYVSVPLQLKAYLSKPAGLAFHIGVEAGFLLSAKEHDKITNIRTMDLGGGMSSMLLWERYTATKHQDLNKSFRNIIYDIPVGLSYENHNFIVSATYRFEVRKAVYHNTYNSGWGGIRNALTARNHAILLTLGYKFRL